MQQEFELDLTTDEGRTKAKEFVCNIVKNDNKELIGKLLFILLLFNQVYCPYRALEL